MNINTKITNPIYTGIFVNEEELKAKYPSTYRNLFYHHSTIEFKPKDISNFPIGRKTTLKIVGRLITLKVDVLIVENPTSIDKYPHITLSTAEGVKPFKSNSEIANNLSKIQPIDNDSIEGVYGIFDGNMIHK